MERVVFQVQCCWYSLESSSGHDSNEQPQHRVWKRMNEVRMSLRPFIWSSVWVIGKQHCLVAVNPFPNKPWFLRVCYTSLLKTLWEKEKLLVTSNFSFSHSVFHLSGELSAIFIKFKIVVCRHFEFGRVKNLLFGKG